MRFIIECEKFFFVVESRYEWLMRLHINHNVFFLLLHGNCTLHWPCIIIFVVLKKNRNASREFAKKHKVENKHYEKLHFNLDKGKFARVKHYLPTTLRDILFFGMLDNIRLHKLSLNHIFNIRLMIPCNHQDSTNLL